MLVRACGFSVLGCRGVPSSVGVRWVHGIRGIRCTVRVFPFRAFALRFVFNVRSMNVVTSINLSRTCRLQLGQVELPRLRFQLVHPSCQVDITNRVEAVYKIDDRTHETHG